MRSGQSGGGGVKNPILVVLAFFALLFAPGIGENPHLNKLMACCFLLLLTDGRHAFKLDLPQKLFFAWLVWAALSCSLSPDAEMSIQGFYSRGEGLLTWFIITGFVVMYWKTFTSLVPMRWMVAVALSVLLLLATILRPESFRCIAMPEMALAGFSSLSLVLLWAFDPYTLIFAVGPLFYSNVRTALFAIAVGIVCNHLLKSTKNLKPIFFGTLIALLLVPFMPIGKRLLDVKTSKMGVGSRSQWIMQAHRLAYERPFLGFGLDTLSVHLKQAVGPTAHRNAIADRVHNIVFDLILQTGWVGYLLLLGSFGAAVGIAWHYRTEQNIACISILCAYLVFQLTNPCGVPAHLLGMIALFGIRRTE